MQEEAEDFDQDEENFDKQEYENRGKNSLTINWRQVELARERLLLKKISIDFEDYSLE